MALFTPATKNRPKSVGQKVILLPQDQLPTKEEFTYWRKDLSLDDSVRVYLPVHSFEHAREFVQKKNVRLFDVAYQLAQGISSYIEGENKIYFSSKKLREHLGVRTKRCDLDTNANRQVTRLSVILPNLVAPQGAGILDSVAGIYLRREQEGSMHIVPTDEVHSLYARGLSYKLFSEHNHHKLFLGVVHPQLIEATIRMDKENGPLDDLISAIGPLAKDIVEVQFYNAVAIQRYNFITYK